MPPFFWRVVVPSALSSLVLDAASEALVINNMFQVSSRCLPRPVIDSLSFLSPIPIVARFALPPRHLGRHSKLAFCQCVKTMRIAGRAVPCCVPLSLSFLPSTHSFFPVSATSDSAKAAHGLHVEETRNS
ncbi:hypothetical protein CGRA01v4_08988 [Colletotrichum graminicola]|nr:hypothetical protein CGRA01v4_08988 [Colletotrichum graminicola]